MRIQAKDQSSLPAWELGMGQSKANWLSSTLEHTMQNSFTLAEVSSTAAFFPDSSHH